MHFHLINKAKPQGQTFWTRLAVPLWQRRSWRISPGPLAPRSVQHIKSQELDEDFTKWQQILRNPNRAPARTLLRPPAWRSLTCRRQCRASKQDTPPPSSHQDQQGGSTNLKREWDTFHNLARDRDIGACNGSSAMMRSS
jgi:hypothetical protein